MLGSLNLRGRKHGYRCSSMDENCIRRVTSLCKKCNGTLKMVKILSIFVYHVHRTESPLQTPSSSAIFSIFFVVPICSPERVIFHAWSFDWFNTKPSRFEYSKYCTCCPVAVDIELWLSIFSDKRLATSFTSCAKLLPTASEPSSNAPVKRFSAPVSLPSTSLNSLSPFSNCFHAINDVVRDSKRFFTLQRKNKTQNEYKYKCRHHKPSRGRNCNIFISKWVLSFCDTKSKFCGKLFTISSFFDGSHRLGNEIAGINIEFIPKCEWLSQTWVIVVKRRQM